MVAPDWLDDMSKIMTGGGKKLCLVQCNPKLIAIRFER